MKLTTLLAAALPLLAVAAPGSTIGDNKQQGSHNLGDLAHAKEGDWKTASDDWKDNHDHVEDHDNIYEGGNNGPFDVKQRGLERRDDIDHFLEECDNGTANMARCVQNLVIPKGSSSGPCVPRTQKTADIGRLHIIDRNVMCRYWKEAGCTGLMTGPYSSAEMDYTIDAYWNSQFVYNPQSYQCQLIGFQAPNIPVKPPKKQINHGTHG